MGDAERRPEREDRLLGGRWDELDADHRVDYEQRNVQLDGTERIVDELQGSGVFDDNDELF
jgi:hypothetical protein